jgi:hypothetical protein
MKKIAILFVVLFTSSFVFTQNTYVPDDKFEQALIDLGYDTTLDDSVLTANISGVTNLDVSDKAIRDLTGIEGFAALTELYCSGNGLTSLDVSKNTALVDIYCNNNQLASLDVSKNTALERLGCGTNNLTSLDVSKNTALTELLCDENRLTSLNMKNGVTIQLLRFSATNNSSLTCIKTLDPTYATTNWTTIDEGVTFSLNCIEDFEWMSSALDTINITQSNLADTYTLQWESSNDTLVNYLLYAQIGVYPAEEIYDTTSLSVSLTYQEILEGVFEGSPVNGATVKLTVYAHDGTDSVKVTGDDRVIYVNRYDYLSVEGEGIPTEFALHENYPNPFNPSTTLRFDLPEVSNITLAIYNMLGQKVKVFNMQSTPAGHHTLKWNATNDYGDPVSAGVYLYQLQSKDFVKTRKMVLLK